MPTLNNGVIMKYLQGNDDLSLIEIRKTLAKARDRHEAAENIQLLHDEIKCAQLAENQPLINKGMVGGAIAGVTSSFIRAAVEHGFTLSVPTIAAHMLYGSVVGSVSGLAIDKFKAPLARFFKPITSRLFHDRYRDADAMIQEMETKFGALSPKGNRP